MSGQHTGRPIRRAGAEIDLIADRAADESAPDLPTPAEDNIAIDVVAMLLADKRSANTRRAYAYDLRAFFRASYDAEPTPALVEQFLHLETMHMARHILRYKARLIAEALTEATINRRMSAILSLVRYARRVGATQANPEDQIDMERVQPYRDTRGISLDQAKSLLAQPDRKTTKGLRDFALLLLLLENALRRAEVVALTLGDCDLDARTIWVHGKGKGTQRERVTLSPSCVEAIRTYLRASRHGSRPDTPLFVNVSPAYRGRGLTADGLFKIVKDLALRAGIKGDLSPHRLRHTAITMALDAADGDVRKVRRLSRHARLETLQIYDDNRTDMQGEITGLLSGLLNDSEDRNG